MCRQRVFKMHSLTLPLLFKVFISHDVPTFFPGERQGSTGPWSWSFSRFSRFVQIDFIFLLALSLVISFSIKKFLQVVCHKYLMRNCRDLLFLVT